MTDQPSAVCGVPASDCSCALSGPHDVHRCACGGEWRGHWETDATIPNDDFEMISFPGGNVGPLDAMVTPNKTAGLWPDGELDREGGDHEAPEHEGGAPL